MNSLFSYFGSLHPLSGPFVDYLTEAGHLACISRRATLLRAGEVCRNLYIVESGLLRCYYRKGGKEISSRFIQEGEICVSPESFFLRKPGQEFIEAIEDTMVSFISWEALQRLYRDFPDLNYLQRTLAEKWLIQMEQWRAGLWMQPAFERYEWFLSRFPDLAFRVPAKYLASYLGMTDVTLSIIKHRVLEVRRGQRH
jgi:CRP-like cAMP-binding protein